MRTGSAGGPGSLEAQRASGGAQKYSGGPSQTDLHRVVQGSQGTIGVVTWITIRAETAPTVKKPFLVGADSLDALVPFVYGVQRSGLGEHAFILDRQALGMLMGGRDGSAMDNGHGPLPVYICLVNVAGFERLAARRLRYQEHDIRQIAGRHGLSLVRELGEVSADKLLDLSTLPCGQIDWRHRARGHCLSIFFLTTLDRTPEFTRLFSDTAQRHGLGRGDIGVYLQPVVQNHACHVEFMIPFDPAAAADVNRMRAFEKEAVAHLAKSGAFFSRPYGVSQEVAFGQNPIHRELLKKVKDIFDPARVLNRGKWGL
jgi:FAD/FMN-containing dehydrogenase